MQNDSYNERFQFEFHDETNQPTVAISPSYQTKVFATLVARWLHEHEEVTGDESSVA